MNLSPFQIEIKKERLKKFFERKKISLQAYEEGLREISGIIKNNEIEASRQPIIEVEDKRPPTLEITKNATNSEFKNKLLERLNVDLVEIDRKKAGLSNSLQSIARNVNAKGIVDEIIELREEWTKKKDEILHVKKYGNLPDKVLSSVTDGELSDEYMSSLPNDKYELDKLIRNLRSNLSKWPKKIDRVKSPGAKAELLQKIALGNLMMDAMVQKMNLL